jgi:hypothetical protein
MVTAGYCRCVTVHSESRTQAVAKDRDIRVGSARSGDTDMPHWVRVSLLLLFVVSFAGCGMSRTHPPSASDVIPIESLASVAGVWKGAACRVSKLWSDGDLMVNIAPGGSYVAWSDRHPPLAMDAGRLLVTDGRLISDTQKLISTFTVVQSHGNPILVVEVAGKDGVHSYVPLVRVTP